MKSIRLCLFFAFTACDFSERRNANLGDAGVDLAPDCVGIECEIAQCTKMGKPPTTISGTVFAPNGTLALFGAVLYVPQADPGPFEEGVSCMKCQDPMPGGAISSTTTDTSGKFRLKAPSGDDVPLYITVGKWRRKTILPRVLPCQDNKVPSDDTRLPKDRSEGNLPKIAITTGGCDALECLIRKLGIADSEFTSDSGAGRVHLYSAGGGSSTSIAATGNRLSPASALWGNLKKLEQYDLALFSCECAPEAQDKPQAMMDNVKQFADLGGRVYLSHYQSVWIAGELANPQHAPAVWPSVATCDTDGITFETVGFIDKVNNPKGGDFAKWMTHVQGSTTPGEIAINDARVSCTAIDHSKAERWVYLEETAGVETPQNFSFTTPLEVANPDDRCGKVVFSDMHVSAGSFSSPAGFPVGCMGSELSPQEKALAFMLFDMATCVGATIR